MNPLETLRSSPVHARLALLTVLSAVTPRCAPSVAAPDAPRADLATIPDDAPFTPDATYDAGTPDSATPDDAAASDAPATTDARDGDVVVLPLGSITGVTAPAPCASDPNLPPGAMCRTLTVSGPPGSGLAPLDAVIAVTEPTGGTAGAGTVVMHGGGAGTAFYNGPDFAQTYAARGFRVVQVKWLGAGWLLSSAGLLVAAARPVTVLRWIHDTYHTAGGFCAVGSSAGSGAWSYALAHYGQEDTLDYVQLVSGPPFGRIDYGCYPSLYTGAPRHVCALTDAPFAYEDNAMMRSARLVDTAEGTTSCNPPAVTPPPDAIARWARDSIVSPGADYDYPHTAVGFWFCQTSPNETTGLGSFYLERITSRTTTGCATMCMSEGVAGDRVAAAAMVAELVAQCTPHR